MTDPKPSVVLCAYCKQPYLEDSRLPTVPDSNGVYVPSKTCSDECEWEIWVMVGKDTGYMLDIR